MGSGFKSLKGQLLLDGGNLAGSFFHRTVVLVCEHDADGAFGLVLNRPTEDSLGEHVEAELSDELRELPVFVGGPVQPNAFTYLYLDTSLEEGGVVASLGLGHSVESLIQLSMSGSAHFRVRVFAGYAGWSPGQLDSEMRRTAWLTHPASLEWVFETDPGEIWRRILLAKGGLYRLLANSPDDLSSN